MWMWEFSKFGTERGGKGERRRKEEGERGFGREMSYTDRAAPSFPPFPSSHLDPGSDGGGERGKEKKERKFLCAKSEPTMF